MGSKNGDFTRNLASLTLGCRAEQVLFSSLLQPITLNCCLRCTAQAEKKCPDVDICKGKNMADPRTMAWIPASTGAVSDQITGDFFFQL